MRSARTSRGAGETMGCVRGGHERLIEAIGDRARSLGVDIRLGAGVEGLVLGSDGAVKGVQVDGQAETFDLTISTLQPPALRRLLPESLQPLLEPYPKRFLGVVCLVMEVKESLLPYYSVNICDPTPITTVVETSHVVGTEHTGGNRLVYLPKYCEASAPEFREDDQSVYDRFTEMLGKLAPGFRHEDVVAWTVQRAPARRAGPRARRRVACRARVAGRRGARPRVGQPGLPAAAQRRLDRADGRGDGGRGRRAPAPEQRLPRIRTRAARGCRVS